jgi:hypothetical protein
VADDILAQAIDEWNALIRRVDDAAEVGWTGFKGLTWDLFIEHKSPTQVLKDVQAKAADFERKEQEYRRRQQEYRRRQQ